MKRSLLSRTGLGPLHCDLLRVRAPENLMNLSPGDFCAWPSAGATLHGKIAEVHASGSVAGAVGRTLSATAGKPVARVEIYRAEGNGWVPTGEFAAVFVKTLIPSAVLTPPVDLTPTQSPRQKARVGSTMQSRVFQGIECMIDRPKGTKISGVGPGGQPYHTEYMCDYGFFPEVKSHDGEDLDCYLGPSETAATKVYLVTQYKARADETKAPVYDETKCVMGCMSPLEAKLLYSAHVHPSMYGGLASLSLDSFKSQLAAAKGQASPVRFEGLAIEDDMPPNPMDSDGSPIGASSSHPNPENFGGQPSGNHDGTPSSSAGGADSDANGVVSSGVPSSGDAIPPTTPSEKLAKQKAADKCQKCGCAPHVASATCPDCKAVCGTKAATPKKGKKHHGKRNHVPAAGPAGKTPQAGAERGGASPGRDAADEDGLHVRAAKVRAMRPEAREVDIIASTEAVDSYGEIVRANWDLTRFLSNPVILWAHNRWNDLPPVGKAKNVQVVKGQLLMTVVFSDITPFDEEVFQKYVQGFLRGFSVGFNPRRVITEEVDGEERVILDENELYEVSCTPIPSNPEALVVSYAKALNTTRERVAKMLHLGEQKAAVPYHPYAVEDATTWDGEAEVNRWRKVCSSDGSGDTSTIQWGKFKTMFAWYDREAPESLSAYKLPHHIVRDGRLFTSKPGVQAAGNAISGGRGGVSIPDADMAAVKDHLARHYAQFDSKAPWDEGKSAQAAATKETDDMDLKQMEAALTQKTTEAATFKASLDAEIQKTADLENQVKAKAAAIDAEKAAAIAAVEAEKTKATQLIEIERQKAAAAEQRAEGLQARLDTVTKRAETAEMKVVEAEVGELVKTKMLPAEQPHAIKIYASAQKAGLLGTPDDPWASYLESVKARAPHGLTAQVIKGAGVPTALDNPAGAAGAQPAGLTHPAQLGPNAERMGTMGGNALLDLVSTDETSTAA